MGRLVSSLFVAVAVAAGFAHSARGAEGSLQPHRAVYDLALGKARSSADVSEASGRLVFEITGNACDGYVVNSRFVTRITDREGRRSTTDLRSSTFETLEPSRFTFRNRTMVDGDLVSEVKGRAEGRADGVRVTLTKPRETEMTLERAVFPTAHTLLMREAAREGERVLEATIFDGGENADTVFETTAIIGQGAANLPGAADAEADALGAVPRVDAMTAWRYSLSYFETTPGRGDGEQTPDYSLSFAMLDNGISYAVRFDYGSFTMTGRLVELDVREPADGDC